MKKTTYFVAYPRDQYIIYLFTLILSTIPYFLSWFITKYFFIFISFAVLAQEFTVSISFY